MTHNQTDTKITPSQATSQEELLRAYVGKKYEKYQLFWHKANKRTSRQSWNWAAFIFCVGWLAYRKMYLIAGIWVALIVLEAITAVVFGYPERWSTIFNIVLGIATGQIGNTLYQQHVNRQIKRILGTNLPDQWINTASEKGGVSILAGIAAVIITGVLVILVLTAAESM